MTPAEEQAVRDSEQLRLLAIFHYVLGVFTIIALTRDSARRLYEPSAD